MDKYEVRLMNQVLLDLDEIYGYIANNLREQGVAAELLDALESEILSLEYLPNRCAERRTGSFTHSGYRQRMGGFDVHFTLFFWKTSAFWEKTEVFRTFLGSPKGYHFGLA